MGQRSLITSICLLALASLPVAPLASAAGHSGHIAPLTCVTVHAGHGHKGRVTSRSCHAAHTRTPVILVFKGTVVVADDTTLTVQSAHQVTHTVTLTDATLTVAPDGSAATVAVGDEVRVTARVVAGGTAQAVLVEDYSSAAPDDGSASDGGGMSNGDATATAVPDQPTPSPAEPTQGATETPSQPAYQVLNGTITALDATSLTVQDVDGAHTFPLGSHISIRLANGTRTTDLSQVITGVYASVYVRSVDGGPFSVCGIVVGAHGEDATSTPPASLASAEPTQEATETPAQTSTAPAYQVLNGTITALDDTSLTVQTDGGARTFPLAAQVSVRLADRTRGSLSQVTVGVEAEVYARSSDGGPFVVVGVVVTGTSDQPTTTADEPTQVPTEAPTEPPAQPTTAPVYQVLNGTITALDGTSLTVQAADGAHTFPLAAQVSVRLTDRTRGSLSQVSVGVEAEVYVRSSDGGPFVVVGVVEVGQQ